LISQTAVPLSAAGSSSLADRQPSRSALRTSGVFAVAAVLFSCLAIAADRSEAYVYWTDDAGNVSRANLDGTGVSNGFYSSVAPEPVGIASNGQFVYWSNLSLVDGFIARAPVEGGGSRFLNIGGAWGLAATSSNLYWASLPGNSVGRYGLNPPGPLVQGLVSPAPMAYSVAVDSNYIYWANSNSSNGQGSIGRATLDGTVKEPNFIPNLTDPRGVAVDGGHVYWTSFAAGSVGSGTIGRADLDGSNATNSFITNASGPIGLAVNSTHIYWANGGSPNNSIGRANIDGTNPNQSFITASASPGYLAIDSRVDPPTLSIDSGPSGPTNSATPSFGFSAQGGSTVTCSVDTGTPDFGPCSSASSHQPGSPLADGDYTFRVRAVLGAETNEKSRSFTVDTVAPDTQITIAPPDKINTPNVTIFFESSGGAVGFQCKLNDSEWSQCTESDYADYNGLLDGAYTFRVRALDAVGNTDPNPAEASFTIDTTPDPDPDPDPVPDSNFSFGKVTPNRKAGTAALQVKVPGAGKVQLLGSRSVAATSKNAGGKATVALSVRSKGATARTLTRRGTVRVKVTVRFTPTGGSARSRSTAVKLVKRR
jgi:hypothetical protein